MGGVVLHLSGLQATPGGGEHLGQVQHLLAPFLELGSGLSDVGGVDVGADGDAEALHRACGGSDGSARAVAPAALATLLALLDKEEAPSPVTKTSTRASITPVVNPPLRESRESE